MMQKSSWLKRVLAHAAILLFPIASYAQLTSDAQKSNEHAGLVNTRFRLVEQPLYGGMFESSSVEIAKEEAASNGLIITCWSSQNKESVEEYRKLLKMMPDLERSHILFIGVSFDECRETWKSTIDKENLDNKWNCIYDLQMLQTQYKDSTLIAHYRQTSLPFTISVRNGIIVGASRTVRFDESPRQPERKGEKH
ncbi:MAG: hypothetical protein QM762_25355 [Chryseolinea sp.]